MEKEKTKFILGYDLNDLDNLKQYETIKQADYNTDEWCIVKADNLEQAKENYEKTFINLKNRGLINGCM
tara:strand:+ start:43 stop:249 length:207 start_codon:yes stop_codon:yes gene_type:complete